MRILLLIALASMTAACAASKPASEADGAAAAQQANAASADSGSADAELELPTGYKPKTKDGETLYCRRQVHLGSRFPVEHCLTAAQLADLENQRQSARDEMSQRGRICSSAQACNPE